MAPLLHMVDMKRKQSHGNMHETPHAPLYVPLQKKKFHTIETNIMTDTGDPVHFVDGTRNCAMAEGPRDSLSVEIL